MKKSNKLKPLSFLIGKWHTSGKLLIGAPESPTNIRGMDTYEWIADRNFILHTVDVFMGNHRTQVTEIIGPDKGRNNFFMTSYDNTGTVATMTATLTKSGSLKLGDKKMRATLSRNKNGSMTAHWELFNKTWQSWMQIELKSS